MQKLRLVVSQQTISLRLLLLLLLLAAEGRFGGGIGRWIVSAGEGRRTRSEGGPAAADADGVVSTSLRERGLW